MQQAMWIPCPNCRQPSVQFVNFCSLCGCPLHRRMSSPSQNFDPMTGASCQFQSNDMGFPQPSSEVQSLYDVSVPMNPMYRSTASDLQVYPQSVESSTPKRGFFRTLASVFTGSNQKATKQQPALTYNGDHQPFLIREDTLRMSHGENLWSGLNENGESTNQNYRQSVQAPWTNSQENDGGRRETYFYGNQSNDETYNQNIPESSSKPEHPPAERVLQQGVVTHYIAALGRQFKIGQLYDIAEDKIVEEPLYWNEDEMKHCIKLDKTFTCQDKIDLVANDTLNSRLVQLNMHPEQWLNLTASLSEYNEGAMKYLKDIRPENSIRVVLNSFYQLSREIFDSKPSRSLGGLSATHVVGAIANVARVIFVFDLKTSNSRNRNLSSSDENRIKGLLKKMLNNRYIDHRENEKNFMKTVSCRLYSDIKFKTEPSTMLEAVSILKKLEDIVQTGNFPQRRIVLLPLPGVSKSMRQLKEATRDSIHNVIDATHYFESEVKRFVEVDTSEPEEFNSVLDDVRQFRQQLSKKLTHDIPAIRRGEKDEKQIMKFFKKINEKFFADKHLLNSILCNIRSAEFARSVNLVLRKCELCLDKEEVIAQHQDVFCCSVKTISEIPNILTDLFHCLEDEDFESLSEGSFEFDKKLMNPTVLLDKIESTLKRFKQFKDANEDIEDSKFIVTVDYVSNFDGAGPLIKHYKNGVADDFQIPDAPGKPKDTEVTSRAITLQWMAPKVGGKHVRMYRIQYREVDGDEWQEVTTNGPETFRTVDNLRQGEYDFRVCAVLDLGRSPYSDTSDSIGTNTSLASRLLENMAPIVDADGETAKPPVYELPLTELNENVPSMTRKVECGNHPDDCLYEKTVMLVGGTGSGKSTLLNGMANYLLHVAWNDDFRFRIINCKENELHKDETRSQTEWITTYKIHAMEGGRIKYCLNIIDTPGFGDTRGVERDNQLIDQIKALFMNDIVAIDAVCVVAQSPLMRLTYAQRYIFDSILSVFGNDIKENIFILVTFADGKAPPVIKSLQEADVPFSKHFVFNNSSLYEDNSGDAQQFSRMFWEMGRHSFEVFFNELLTTKSKSLQLSADVLKEREMLEVTVSGLHQSIKEGISKLDTLRQEEIILQSHRHEIEQNKNFKYRVKEPRFQKLHTRPGQYVTNCLTCNRTCHENCIYANNADKAMCCAMNHSMQEQVRCCSVCPGYCHWTQHVNNDFYYIHDEVEVERTYFEMQQRYQMANAKKRDRISIVDRLKQDMEIMKYNVFKMVDNIRVGVNRIREIALRPNPLTITEHVEMMIEGEKAEKKFGYQRRMQVLTEFKEKAELIRDVEQTDFNPFSTLTA